MAIAEHLVATTRGRDASLLEPERAGWLWSHLCAAMPEAFSCVLMPDHLHLVVPLGLRALLVRVLAAFSVRFAVRFDVLEPQVATTAAILGRMIRYGFLNGVRAGLVDDPWAWPWSTLRDLGGATVPIWTPVGRVASSLRLSASDALRALTRLGDARPPLPDARRVTVASTEAVRDAVASALRLSDPGEWAKARPRRLVVQACYAIGAPRPGDLADALACSERSIHRDRSPRDAGLDAVLLCLGDPRLRIHGLSPRLPTSRRRSA